MTPIIRTNPQEITMEQFMSNDKLDAAIKADPITKRCEPTARANKMADVRVSTRKYEGAHGKKPRGWGAWVFETNLATTTGHRLTFTITTSYGTARKEAVKFAKAAGATTMDVMP